MEELVIYQILINNKIQEFEEGGELELPRERNYGIFSTFFYCNIYRMHWIYASFILQFVDLITVWDPHTMKEIMHICDS